MITKGEKVGRSSACKGEDSFDGLVFSALATVGQITIVGKQVYDMTGSELNLGLLGLAEFLPVALLSPFTGPVADRFDRRKVFSLALVAQAITSFLLFLYVASDLMAFSLFLLSLHFSV